MEAAHTLVLVDMLVRVRQQMNYQQLTPIDSWRWLWICVPHVGSDNGQNCVNDGRSGQRNHHFCIK